jgi:hypothetical protein
MTSYMQQVNPYEYFSVDSADELLFTGHRARNNGWRVAGQADRPNLGHTECLAGEIIQLKAMRSKVYP